MKKVIALTLLAIVSCVDFASAQSPWGGFGRRPNPYGAANNWANRMNDHLCSTDPGCNGEDGTRPKYQYHGGGQGYYVPGYGRPMYRPMNYRQENPFVARWRQAFTACNGVLQGAGVTMIIDGQKVVIGGGGRSVTGRPCFWINTQFTTGIVPNQQLGNFAIAVAVNEQAFAQIWADLFSRNEQRMVRALEGIRMIAVHQQILPEEVLTFAIIRSTTRQPEMANSEGGQPFAHAAPRMDEREQF